MNRSIVMLACLGLFAVVQPAERAAAQVTFGPQVTLADLSELGIGGQVEFGLADAFGIEEGPMSNLTGFVNISYLFGAPYGAFRFYDDLDFGLGSSGFSSSAVAFNVGGKVPFEIEAGVTPYVGGGINFTNVRLSYEDNLGSRFSESVSSTDGGINLLGGINFELGELPGSAELGYVSSGPGYLSLTFRVMFGG